MEQTVKKLGTGAQEQLERVQRLHETILNSVSDGICGIDSEGKITFVNGSAAGMLGYRPGELIGQEEHRLIHRWTCDENALDQDDYPLRATLIKGESHRRRRAIFTRKDGSCFPVECRCEPLVERGKVVGAVLVFRDLTRLRQAEDERDRLLSLIEESPAVISTSDTAGNIIYMNKAGRRLLGIDDDSTPTGLTVEDATWPFLDMAARDGVWQGERKGFLKHLLPDGKGFPVLQTVVAHRGSSGSIEFFSTIAMDISEQERVKEERLRLVAILEETPDFVATADTQGRVLYYNRAARRILGIGPDEEISNIQIRETHPEWASRLILDEGLPTAARVGIWSAETELLSRDGRVIPVSQVIIAHKNAQGMVEYYSTIARDISERKRMEERLHHLATHDDLTGLANRRLFNEELRAALSRAQADGASGAILVMDLDALKDVNDSFGHHVGDRVLRETAALLRRELGGEALIARVAGDEFAVLLPGTGLERARTTALRLLEAVSRQVIEWEEKRLVVTMSVGVALYPKHGATEEKLMVSADAALYRSKRSGGNYVSIYDPDHDEEKHPASRFSWNVKLRDALERRDFSLYCQPIVNLQNGMIAHYEFLLRLETGEGIVMPRAFLPRAEQSGLIRMIDRYVVGEAIRWAEEFQKRGKEEGISVNLSGKTLGDFELVEFVEQELRKREIDPSKLTFEITERVAITGGNAAKESIFALHEMGIGFALDDFGVGFSSLHSLKELPFRILKIDGSFIRDIVHNEIDQVMVRSMVEIAHCTGKSVVAEYIEDQATFDFLKAMDVDFGQGYHIGRPRPVAAVV